MINNMRELEKILKSFAKRNKNIKYTGSLLFLFLMTGIIMMSHNLNASATSLDREIKNTERTISSSINDIRGQFKKARAENNKLLRNANLELIMLMEEGDHIVKSPWSSWQFGTGYTYSKWNGSYKGENNKDRVYPYYGRYSRSGNLDRYIGEGNKYFYNLAKNNYGSPVEDITAASTIKRGEGNITNTGFANVVILNEKPLIADVNANVFPKEVARLPQAPKVNPVQPPSISIPTVNYSINVIKPKSPETAAVFNIDLGAYCNSMNYCLWQDETFEGYDSNLGRDYGFYDPFNTGDYGGYEGYAGFRHYNNDTPVYNPSVYGSGNTTSGIGMNSGSLPSLIYSWNLSSATSRGQWRLFTTYLDVQSDMTTGEKVDLKVDTGHTVSSINNLKSMTDANFRDYVTDGSLFALYSFVPIPGENTNISYEKFMNRTFNTQPFFIGGSRFATLDNAITGSFVDNGKDLNLLGPLTIGLEIQYDKIGSGKRNIKNSGNITDMGEESNTDLDNIISRNTPITLNLGIYDWLEEIHSFGVGGGTLFMPHTSTQSSMRISAKQAADKEFYRNSEGYIGGKIGLILTREDGEERNLMADDMYTLSNSGKIEFRGDDSIGIQVYSPLSSKDKGMDYAPGLFKNIQTSTGLSYEYYADFAGYTPAPVTLSNTGTIITAGTKSYGMKISSRVDIEKSSLTNEGIINIAGYDERTAAGKGNSAGIAVLEDPGQSGKTITDRYYDPLTGNFSPGYIKPDGTFDSTVTTGETKPVVAGAMVENKGSINIAGKYNSGMFLQTAFEDTFTSSGNINIKTDIISANPTIYDDTAVGNIGIRIDSGIVSDEHTLYSGVLRDSNTGAYEKGFVLSADNTKVDIDGDGISDTDSLPGFNENIFSKLGTQRGINTSSAVISIEAGDENIGMLAAGGNAQVINNGTIIINDSDNTTNIGNYGMATASRQSFLRLAGADGILWTADDTIDYTKPTTASTYIQMGYLENSGTITIHENTLSKNNVAILINSDDINDSKGTGKTTGTSVINVNAGENIGVANFGNFTMEGGVINAKGTGSVAVYSNFGYNNGTGAGASDTQIKGDSTGVKAVINAVEGAVALYSENNGTTVDKTAIKLENTDITVDNGALLFYNYTSPTAPSIIYTPTGQLQITGSGANALIKNNGLAFILKRSTGTSPYWNLNDITGNILQSGSGDKLTLKLENGARLFLIDAGSDATVATSDLTNIQNSITAPSSGIYIDPSSGNFKYITLKAGTFNVNSDVDLSSPTNAMFVIDYIASNVNIDPGVTVTNVDGTGEGQAFAGGDRYVIAQINPKTLAGGTVNGIVINNNGSIIVKENSANEDTVKDTIGIVADYGTVNNTGELINTTDRGVGILGTRSSMITNTGNITAGNDGTGIYGTNKLPNTAENGNINISSSGNIKIEGNNNTAGYGIIAVNENESGTAVTTSLVTVNGGSIDTGAKNRGSGIYVRNGRIAADGTYISGSGITANSVINALAGNINSGRNGAGIIHINGITNVGNVTLDVAGENSTGIYHRDGGAVNLNSSTLKIGNKGSGVYTVGADIINNGVNLTSVGNDAIIYAVENAVYSNPTAGTSTALGNDSVYIFARGNGGAASVTNNTDISVTGGNTVVLYGSGNVNITNNSSINLNDTGNTDITKKNGLQNVGILMTGNGGNAVNTAVSNINVGISDRERDLYSIGMAADGTGINIVNDGTITVSGNRSIGMYGSGNSTVVRNNGTILLDASGASAGNEITGMTGMYIANGAKGYNYGVIKTGNNYTGNNYVRGIYGIVIKDATFENHNKVEINAEQSGGVFISNGIIKNYGEITITGSDSRGIIFEGSNTTTEGISLTPANGEDVNGINPLTGIMGVVTAPTKYDDNLTYDPSNSLGSVKIKGDPDLGLINSVTVNDVEQTIHNMTVDMPAGSNNTYISNLGIYIDTLGRTNAIKGLENLFNNPGIPESDTKNKINIMFGAELADITNEKVIRVPQNIIAKIKEAYPGYNFGTSSFTSGAYHWIGSMDVGDTATDLDDTFVMAKIPYTDYARKGDIQMFNFLDGLEQRYDRNALDSAEKDYFNKLNSIGDGEAALWVQAVDEALGRQYINVSQRIYETSKALDKEIDGLRDWRNGSKEVNKMITFGSRGEYKTESAQIHNYKNRAYGVAYINENEKITKGAANGWYAGIVHNTFDFKDIGKSREKMLMLKTGLYKAVPLGKTKSSIWTVSGELFAGHNEMKRRFLNVDTIYQAEGSYLSYGAAVKNELTKDLRLSERFTLTPYGSLKLEYGRHNSIKEKDGVLRLAVDSGDYYSIKPEVGLAFKYKQPMALKTTFTASLSVGYETELGKVTDNYKNFRVNYTNAGSYRFKGEKDDKTGNLKTDFNIGVENRSLGLTFNAGYDTKGDNLRGGLGLRLMY